MCFLLASSYVTGAALEVDGGSALAGPMWEVPEHANWPPPHAGDLAPPAAPGSVSPFVELARADAAATAASRRIDSKAPAPPQSMSGTPK